VGGLLALEGAARILARPWPSLADFALRPETLAGQPRSDAALRVLVVGDSIVRGWGAAYAQSYPALLEHMWAKAYPDAPVAFVNGGVDGLTCVPGIHLLPLLLEHFHPDVVIVSFGLNDCNLSRSCLDARREEEFMVPAWVQTARHSRLFTGLERRWRRNQAECASWTGNRWEPRVSEEAFSRALAEMARQVRLADAVPILLTTTTLAPGFRPDVDAASREELRQSCERYNALIRQTAQETGAGLVDVYGNLSLEPGDWAEDGVHLTPSGYRRVAEYLFEVLELLLTAGLGGESYAR